MGAGEDYALQLMAQYPWIGRGTADSIAVSVVRQGKDLSEFNHLLKDPNAPTHSTPPSANRGGYVQRQQASYDKYREQNAQKEADIYSDVAPQYAQAMQDIIEGLYPNQSGLGELIAGDITERLEQDNYVLPDSIKDEYLRASRGAQSDRGLFRSGMGAEAESSGMARLGLIQRESDLDRGQALAAGIPKVKPVGSIPGDVPKVNDYYTALLQNQFNYDALDQNSYLQQQKLNQNSLDSWRNYQLATEEDETGGSWGSALGGAAAGAKIGGSLMPGWGTVVGGALGGLAGLFG